MGGCGCCTGLGNDRPLRDVEELALMGEWVFGPHLRNHADGLSPLRLGLLRVDLEAVHLDEGGRASGAQVHAAVAEDVQHGSALGDADRVVVLRWQQGHGVSDADALGAL